MVPSVQWFLRVDGLVAVTADDPRTETLDVVDVAPPGMLYRMAWRSVQEIDLEPKARRWTLHADPAARRTTS